MSYTEIDTELLLLAANGRERDQLEAKRRMREMPPEEWRLLQEAVSRLDDWLDDVIFERYQARHARKNGRQ